MSEATSYLLFLVDGEAELQQFGPYPTLEEVRKFVMAQHEHWRECEAHEGFTEADLLNLSVLSLPDCTRTPFSLTTEEAPRQLITVSTTLAGSLTGSVPADIPVELAGELLGRAIQLCLVVEFARPNSEHYQQAIERLVDDHKFDTTGPEADELVAAFQECVEAIGRDDSTWQSMPPHISQGGVSLLEFLEKADVGARCITRTRGIVALQAREDDKLVWVQGTTEGTQLYKTCLAGMARADDGDHVEMQLRREDGHAKYVRIRPPAAFDIIGVLTD